MKFVIILALAVVAVSAYPQKDIEITKLENENPGDGNYKFGYAQTDGTSRDESGSLKTVGDVQAQTVQGEVTWTSPEGQVIKQRYISDENGYQVFGDHIPK